MGVPGFGALLFSSYVYFVAFRDGLRVSKRVIFPFSILFLLYLIWMGVAVFSEVGDVSGFFRGMLNLIGAFYVLGALSLAFQKCSPEDLRRVSLAVLIVFFVGLFFEFLFGLDYLNSIRSFIYRDEFYSASARDMNLWGVARPLFIFQEPSYVGIYVSIFSFLYVSLRFVSDVERLKFSLLLFFLFFFVLRSPTLFSVPLFFLAAVAFSRFGSLVSFGIFIVGFSASLLYLLLSFESISTLTEEGYSFNARILNPVMVLFYNFSDIFLLGSGLGVIPDEYISKISYLFYLDLEPKYLLTNSFFEFFIYHGIIGGIIFGLIWYACINALASLKFIEFLLIVLIFWNMVGGVVTLISVLLIGVIALARSHSSRFE